MPRRPTASSPEPTPEFPSAQHVGRTMRAASRRPYEIGQGDGVVEPREVVDAVIVGGKGLSLKAHKALLLMIRCAGSDGWKDQWHKISKSDLLRSTHQSTDRLRPILDELRSVQLRLLHRSTTGRMAAWEAPIVAETERELGNEGQSIVRWRFSGPMREVLRTSEEYADLQLDVILPLTSSYSLRLYEIGTNHVNRRHPVWRGTKAELREALRVPGDAYRDWTDLRRKTLEVAKAEIDHLAPFTMDWRVTRRGRIVDEVEIHFILKDHEGRQAASAELTRSRTGRKARREGQVEKVVEEPDVPAVRTRRRRLLQF